MRYRSTLSFQTDEEDEEFLKKRFKKDDIEIIIWSLGDISIELYEDTKDFEDLMYGLKAAEIPFKQMRRRVFTKEEEQKVPYFRIIPPIHRDLLEAKRFGTEFGPPECPVCYQGSQQLNPAHLRIKRALKYDFFRMTPLVIISAEIKDKLEEIEASGYELEEVIDDKTKEADPRFYQLLIPSVLPSADGHGYRVIDCCRKCGSRSIVIPGMPAYQLSDFSEQKDFYLMSEMVWNNRLNLPPERELIVSRRVKDILAEYDCSYTPLFFEEMFKE